MQPRYEHDCTKCIFLGRHEQYDLYICHDSTLGPSIQARFSSRGEDYASGIAKYAWRAYHVSKIYDHPPLNAQIEGIKRALEQGIISDSDLLFASEF